MSSRNLHLARLHGACNQVVCFFFWWSRYPWKVWTFICPRILTTQVAWFQSQQGREREPNAALVGAVANHWHPGSQHYSLRNRSWWTWPKPVQMIETLKFKSIGIHPDVSVSHEGAVAILWFSPRSYSMPLTPAQQTWLGVFARPPS